MNLTKSIVAAALAVTTTLGIVPATQAQARSSVSISYRDYDYRGDYRGDRRDYRRDYRRDDRRHRWDRDRDGIPDRYDRYDNRRWGWNDGYRYRDARRCWTEWRYDRWQDERVAVRFCR
jgi:hypothetical protein